MTKSLYKKNLLSQSVVNELSSLLTSSRFMKWTIEEAINLLLS